jgi:FtsZ-binding cell division protein ZapB
LTAGIKGAIATIDGILITAETLKEHDMILRQVIQRAADYNLKLNFDRCKIRK